MLGNGKKNKVEIKIILDESGQVGVNFSTNNIVTVLGMIETAKALIIQNQQQAAEPKSNIVVPRFNP